MSLVKTYLWVFQRNHSYRGFFFFTSLVCLFVFNLRVEAGEKAQWIKHLPSQG